MGEVDIQKMIDGQKERQERAMREIGADYVAPDGCQPFPDGVWVRTTDESISKVTGLIGDQLPGQSGFTLEVPVLSEDERAVLEQSAGAEIASVLDRHLKTL